MGLILLIVRGNEIVEGLLACLITGEGARRVHEGSG